MDSSMKSDNQPPRAPLQVQHHEPPQRPIWQIIMVAAIAAGVQFGWALQLSLLTPYVQLIGVPHTWSSFIWLCGPISGMIVQPVVGYYSDRCTSRFGRRRPFIAGGAFLVAIAVFLIGYAADIGVSTGDKVGAATKPRAIGIFVVGFWILDVANNTLQGPCRALLADLAGSNSSRIRTGNAMFAFFMGVGNVLGYAAGSYTHLYRIVPFTKTDACDVYCANLKTCFFISIALLVSITVLAMSTVSEEPFVPEPVDEKSSTKQLVFFGEMLAALKELSRPMWILLLVTCLNWIAWFPFLLFDTDWMGKEVYGGKVGEGQAGQLYNRGVRAGALGLMLNSVVSGLASLGIEHLARWIGGVKRLWGGVNFLLAICLAMTVLVTKLAESSREFTTLADGTTITQPPSSGVRSGALAIFAILGAPLAVIIGQATVQRCSATVEFSSKDKPFFPATINDNGLHEFFQDVAGDVLGPSNVKTMLPLMGSEDFSVYQEVLPGYFYFLGMKNESNKNPASVHSPFFEVNEDILPFGAAMHASLVANYLTEIQKLDEKNHDEL